jgi:D-alanyl-D-alanine endopeptidase (penicillin-binding protein 7)
MSTLIVSITILGVYYRFGYPLRNPIEHSFCVNATLATAAALEREVFRPTDRKLSRKPYLNCKAAIAVDNTTHEILLQKNAETARSIASVTKLMTAMVLIDLDFDWSRVVKISRQDARNSAKSRLKTGETFYATDLFYASLICSDNRAARTLARSSGVSMERFVELMNEKAKSLGLFGTRFGEVTGLSPENKSTAADCARLINAALKEKLIATACTTNRYTFRSLNHKRRRNIVNTNLLLRSKWKVKGGKTGYILESGHCLAVRLVDERGHDITVVILGAPGKNTRFAVARSLARWAFKNLNRLDQEDRHVAEGIDGSGTD